MSLAASPGEEFGGIVTSLMRHILIYIEKSTEIGITLIRLRSFSTNRLAIHPAIAPTVNQAIKL